MNKIISLLFIIFFITRFTGSYAQLDQASPAYKWAFSSKKIAEKKYELELVTSGPEGLSLYGPGQDLDGVPSASLTFTDSSVLVDSFYNAGQAETVVSTIFNNKKVQVIRGIANWKAIIHFTNTVPSNLIATLSVFYNKGDEFIPDIPSQLHSVLEGGVSTLSRIKINAVDVKNPVNDCGDEDTRNKSLMGIFLLGFLGGLIALITPCVFPMIPVTVTFFTKKSGDKKKGVANAILYGFFIFLIYVLITLPFHLAGQSISPEIYNNISTNSWLNLFFFIVFVAFALSFFGLYEIGLPSGLANKTNSKSGLGNIGGLFFMAATLAIVSFSCTGPILGSLLANVANGGPWPLTMGAAGFGLALGLPFALFALFPNWLHSLPRSGGWMTDVKVVLGFVELAMGVKFLANADNVEQWGILKREVFVMLWILIGVCIVLYLVGKLKIGHPSLIKKYSGLRIFFIVLFSVFTLYLIPGLTNTQWAGLRLLSGFPPPLSYSIYGKNHVMISNGVEPITNDYEGALAKAREEHKPLLLDFTGWACVNCRRMEEKVWTNKEVYQLMHNDFIVVSLYVDERRKLPASAQNVYTNAGGSEKNIITVGDKWATFQIENFGATSQPQYAIISPDEKALTKTKYYTPDPKEFAEWLRCGIKAMKSIKPDILKR